MLFSHPTSLYWLGYINIDDFDIVEGFVGFIHPNVFDGVNDLQSGNRTTKDGMLVVQPWSDGCRHEELRTVSIRPRVSLRRTSKEEADKLARFAITYGDRWRTIDSV